jgi:hypothetical protein
LNDVYIRTATVNALISRKETILPRIRQWLNSPSASQVSRVTCLKILGKIQDPRAIPDLLAYLADANVEFRHETMVSLHRCGYRFDSRDLDLFKKALYLEIAGAIQVASMQADTDAMDNPMLLFDALEVAWKHHRERVFLLLRMLYDPSLVQRVLDNLDLGSPEKRAYALEVLDTALADEFKGLIFPLLEDLGYARRLELWNRSLKLVGISNLIKVDTILDSPPNYSLELFTPWVKSCVIQALFTDPRYRDKIGNLQDENRLVQNTLDWTKAFLSKKEKTMLSIIERVMILKTVSIFGETPDYLLAEIANLLEEQHFKSDETFIHKGDPANCMYIIVNGDIKIHDGDREFNHLGARDIVGEMAVLDQIPRSASATTVIPTHLLKLDRAPLFELIADRAEVAQGIIRVLVGRLRTTMNSTAK